MNRLVLEQVDVRPGERVLEVGFGGGDLLASLLNSPAQEIVGIDISDEMVKRARRRFRRDLADGRLRLLTASAEALPRREGGFDKVCSVNTIYFWKRPAAVLSELARVTRAGGRLLLAFQTPESVRRWPGHVHGFHAYGADEIAGLMEAAGFDPPKTTSGSDEQVGDFLCLTSERK
jgi:ubiquinone/menaquinone biosynthesis C-methylase UbiE